MSGIPPVIVARAPERRYIPRVRDEPTTGHTLTPVPRVEEAPACVVIIHGGELGRCIKLPENEITIGRDDGNGISIPLHTISRQHARLFLDDRTRFVEDLGSTNGTFLNDEEVVRAMEIHNGDLLRCGGAVLKFIEGGNIEALYHEEIYRLTITDGMTQIANKRHLLDFLDREIARATRHHRPLSLVLFDIDLFKNLNDRFGHLAGDQVLKGIAAVVASQVRREELLARYGGDEMAVVLPETTVESAALFCERIRSAVESATFDYDGEPLAATISLGVTALEGSDSPASLIARADAQLYRAKDEGRNRTAWDLA
jgi:two-component system, cell cycle response regulator